MIINVAVVKLEIVKKLISSSYAHVHAVFVYVYL